MPARMEDVTTYRQDFVGANDYQTKINDSVKRNEFRDLNRKGSLSPDRKLPFNGKSTSKSTFIY
jgi:hypothetical protein